MEVIKRSGRKVDFESNKIRHAIISVFDEVREGMTIRQINDIAKKLTKIVVDRVKEKYDEPHVEQIQDIVEDILIEENFKEEVKAYIRYREQRKQNRKQWIKEKLPLSLYTRKYQFNGESFEQFFDRVANGNNIIRKYLKNKLFVPAGRILANRGLREEGIKITYSNCYVTTPPEDNLESIFETAKKIARTFSYGGGTGVDLSNLRPQGAVVRNSAKTTSGPISFIEIYDSTSKVIGQKGRRAALMLMLDCNHPDVENFIDLKRDLEKATKANLSIKVDNNFMQKVENEETHNMEFEVKDTGEKIKAEESASKIFNKFAHANWQMAEPGLLFWDRINNWNLLSEDDNFEYGGTNPCVTGDTLIRTVEGSKPIKDLVGKRPYIYCMGEEGKLDIRRAKKIFKTKENAKVVEVITGKGSIKCTTDHLIRTTNRGWVEAQKLQKGDKVKGLNRQMTNEKECSVGLSGEGYEPEHRFIAKYFTDIEGKDVHHINGDSLDNRLSNFEVLEHGEHSKISNLGHECYADRDPVTGKFLSKDKHKKSESINLGKQVGTNWYVKDVKELNERCTVYDMKVPQVHNYLADNIIVHNCGEEPLPSGGSCLLGAVNLDKFVKNSFSKNAEFDFAKFNEVVEQSVIYLNDVLEEGLKLHPLKEQRESVYKWKQIGLGLMGIADMFIRMRYKYGEQESIALSHKIGFNMINKALQTSAKLAKYRGPYPECNKEAILASDFIKENASNETKDMIKKYGLRNSQLLTIAPTGSISNLMQVSGGIEPIFKISYNRKTETLHDKEEEYEIFTPIVEEYMEEKGIKDKENLPDFIVDAHQLDYEKRIEMQSTWQKYIDASISSTINLPEDTSVSEVKDLYLKAWKKGLKGVTIFRNNCQRDAILTGNEEQKEKQEMTKQDFIDQGICPECYDDLINTGGCKECRSCGFSGCTI